MRRGHAPRRVGVALDPIAIDIVEIERPGIAMGEGPTHLLPGIGDPRIQRLQVFERVHQKRYLLGDELVIVSPDVGGVVRARAIASRLGADLAIIDKRREKAGESEVMNIIGEVSGRRCILVDDIVDSAGTLCNAAEALMQKGAKAVEAYTTHGVLSGGAVARVTASPLESLVTTDSIQATEAVEAAPNIRQLPIAPLLAEAILRIAENRSVSSLFV